MYRRLLLSVFICILSVLGASYGKTTVATKPPATKPPNWQSLPNRTKIITTRFGADGVTPEQQCQCTVFYLCASENQVPLGNGQSCEENYVCCTDIVILTTPEPTIFINSGGSNGGNTGTGSGTGNNGGSGTNGGLINPGNNGGGSVNQPNRPTTNIDCVCVPPTQCNRDPEAATSGAGEIDIKSRPCSIYETCCPQSLLINGGTGGTGGNGNQGTGDGNQGTGGGNQGTSGGNQGTGGGNQGTGDGNQGTGGTGGCLDEYQGTGVGCGATGTGGTDQSLCGVRNAGTSVKITTVGSSSQTVFGEFPWMALLLTTEISPNGERTDNVFVCGASLLSTNIVLTGAHCVNTLSIDTLKVRVGEYDTHLEAGKEPKPHQDRTITQVILHQNFNPKTLFNDIALLKVSEPFVLDTHIAPICIPPMNTEFTDFEVYDPNNCVATGWGKNSFGADAAFPIVLKKVDLSLVGNDQCQQQLRGTRLGPAFILDQSFICAQGQPGSDTCEGDGGGPLVCPLLVDPSRYVQVGITAWGIGCGNEIPSVYSSISTNIDWLVVQFNTLAIGFDTENRFGGSKNVTKPHKPVARKPSVTTKKPPVTAPTTVKPTAKPTVKPSKPVKG